MSSELVKRLQFDLDVLGFDPGDVDGAWGQKTKKAVLAFQASIGMPQDGLLTSELVFAAKAARQVMDRKRVAPPHGLLGIQDTFGAFQFSDLSGGNVDIDDNWEAANLVLIENVCDTGLDIRLHRKVVDVFEESLLAAMAAAPKYKIRQLGGFCARRMKVLGPVTKPPPLSVHSWGAAFDINWNTNPFSKTLVTDLPSEFVAQFTKRGWNWGGNWRSKKDAMHFQYCTGY